MTPSVLNTIVCQPVVGMPHRRQASDRHCKANLNIKALCLGILAVDPSDEAKVKLRCNQCNNVLTILAIETLELKPNIHPTT